MPDVAPYYVVVDANIWVAERLLQSSIGSAFLYVVTGAKSSILLPEVVELEIGRVFPDLAERSVGLIKRELSLLRQLSGHDLHVTAPSALAIEEGIKQNSAACSSGCRSRTIRPSPRFSVLVSSSAALVRLRVSRQFMIFLP
jgi:hypothetical protein